MNQINRYGLSRHIPEPIARNIRQRCGFGCVKCGFAIYQYHHFDPSFEHAKEHREDDITLLCPSCHELEKKGLLSARTVERYNDNPACLKRGSSNFLLDLRWSPEVILGNITFVNTPNMIEVFGKSLLIIEGPEDSKTPFSISAVFHDESGKEIATINRNEWRGDAKNWDIKSEGNKVIIREYLRKISLILKINPPNQLIVERLDMLYKGFRIVALEGEPTTFFLPDGKVWFKTDRMNFISNANGIVLQ
ncbi:MAG: hypothetical protein L3J49_04725 [Desulfobulbaceae bacterium]|nr:hypothetical protein [Desulfobulbaceae bacterium]